MKKFTMVVFLLVASLALVFANGASEQKTEVKPEVVKLKVWYSISGANGELFASQVKAFDEQRADIEIEELTYTGSYADSATKISAAKLSGDAPDFVITSASQIYTGEDGNYSMEENVKDPEFKFSDIYPGMLDYARFQGGLAALPYGISTQVLYYNKDLVKSAGIDLENNPPKTWEEFKAVAKKIKEVTGQWGFDTSDGVWLIKSILSQNGNEVVKSENGEIIPVFNNEKGVEVAEFWKSLVTDGIMPAGQHDNAEKKFLAGNLAFIAATSARISKWKGNVDFELGAIEMPYFERKALALGGSTLTIMAKDKYKQEAAWELAKWVLSLENQTEFALFSGYMTLYKSASELDAVKQKKAENELFNVASKQLDYTWAYTHFANMGSMDAFFWYALDEIERGVKTPKKAFDDAAESLIKEMR